MKKIFTLLFAAFLFISMNAEVLTIVQAYEIGMALDSMETSETEYIIEGYVINAGTFRLSFRDQSYYLVDEADATASDFWAYNCFAIEGNDTLKVLNGDKVQLVGKLKKYWSRNDQKFIIEIEKGNASFVSKVDGSRIVEAESISVAQAIEIAQTLDKGTYSDNNYEISGYVTAMSRYSDGGWSQYGNQGFWIVDDKDSKAQTIADGAFEVYRGIASEEVHVGDKISIIAQLWRSSGGNVFQTSTGRVTIIEKAPVPKLPKGVISCDSAVVLAASIEDPVEEKAYVEGPNVKVRGYITYAYVASETDGKVIQSAWISDTKGSSIGIIQGTSLEIESLDAAVAVGDYVQLEGTLAKYMKAARGDRPAEIIIDVINGKIIKGPFIPKVVVNATPINAGSVSINDNVLTAVPNDGCHFIQWSDGITDNPRTIELIEDTTLIAEFVVGRTGTCGTDLALTWTYDPEEKVLTISGEGAFNDNMQCGVEARLAMKKIVFTDGVTSIGASAFANCATLDTLVLGKDVKKIGENAFYNCENLKVIYNYRPTPTNAYSNTFDGVDKFECYLFVPKNSLELYKNAAVWRDFYYTQTIIYTYTVKFVDWDGTVLSSIKVEEDSAAIAPINPTREGYTFVGWDKDFSHVTEDMTIIALYKINRYYVQFLDWDNTILKADSVDWNTAAVAPANPSREGYDFTGWDREFSSITSNLVVQAQYEFGQTMNYPMTFINSRSSEEIFDEVVTIKVPAAPIISGFTFVKWEIVSGDLADGFVIQAVYKSDTPTSAPAVYTNPANPAQKLIRNGNVYILTEDKTYTVTGIVVK